MDKILVLCEAGAGGLPSWLSRHFQNCLEFWKWWYEHTFPELEIKFTLKCHPYSHILILTQQFIDHPCNTVKGEPGWCDWQHGVIYVRTASPRFFDGLFRFFKRLSREQWWQNYNGAKVSHELAHLAYSKLAAWGLERRDRTHDFSFFRDREYWTRDFELTTFGAKDWLYVTQRVR
jgi:hypothetical protein